MGTEDHVTHQASPSTPSLRVFQSWLGKGGRKLVSSTWAWKRLFGGQKCFTSTNLKPLSSARKQQRFSGPVAKPPWWFDSARTNGFTALWSEPVRGEHSGWPAGRRGDLRTGGGKRQEKLHATLIELNRTQASLAGICPDK